MMMGDRKEERIWTGDREVIIRPVAKETRTVIRSGLKMIMKKYDGRRILTHPMIKRG